MKNRPASNDYWAFVRKHANLQKAWQTIKSNGRKSSSPYVVDDIAKFAESEQTNIRSISARLQHQSYKFSAARGVALEKPGKPGSIRPIVIPKASDRVVQRCILDALVSDPRVVCEAFQPFSFGGVPKKPDQKLAGVSAAIETLLKAIQLGGTHVIVADIASFFTKISKSEAVKRISHFTEDQNFLKLFSSAIEVDLENHSQIWQHKDSFPYGDIGVGQGVCLSPFIGNLVLSDFDREMNKGDCRCIRYVDDIIIIAPTGKAASANYRKAVRILNEKGMIFSKEKTNIVPVPVTEKFEYLGIEFFKGKIRPAPKARQSIVNRTRDVATRSLREIRLCSSPRAFNNDYCIPKTLNKISSMAKGWAHHYVFCNDIETIKNVDRQISASFLSYADRAISIAKERMIKNPDFANAFFGYQGASEVSFQSFDWPGES